MYFELIELIKECKEYLDQEIIDEVMHYFKHDEYEMSLEGLIIEMIKAQKYPKNVSIDAINDLVLYYNLNVESVFDHNFWEKYTKWLSKA